MRTEITIFDLGYLSKEKALKVREKLEGKTYMNFRVDLGLCPSGYGVTISTDYSGASYSDIAEFLMSCMAEII